MTTKTRVDGRRFDQARPVSLKLGIQPQAAGSVLVGFGATEVVCAASIEDRVPRFLKGSGQGWITAEYGMLPCATDSRHARPGARGAPGRSHEIQRLIGRSLRGVTKLKALGERTIHVDCDVMNADGGTRTASVTGGFVALVLALDGLRRRGLFQKIPVADLVAAVSVGIVEGDALLDLCYAEDAKASVDMNLVMTGKGAFVEIQGTGEEATFDQDQLTAMLDLARVGIKRIVATAREALASVQVSEFQSKPPDRDRGC